MKEFIKKSFDDTNVQSKFQLEEHIKNHIILPINETQQKLIEQFSKLPELISQSSNIDHIQDKLETINSKWISTIDTIILDVKHLDTSVESYIKFSNDSFNNSPLIIKGVLGDLVHNLEQQTANISYIVNSIQKDIHSNTTNVASPSLVS